ncbi:hypothetical protein [Intestinimonas butyriciproducens]|uniref:hypothetical protein n=1 Tax=Intestinimonas butyriciproducens TaxID=1297617 RepID=UPI001D08866D|nr:hypothetical protein [Intestinimonas butyriciproducens]
MVCVEVSDNVCHRLAAGVHLKYSSYDWRSIGVNLKTLLAVHIESQCHISACGKAFFGVDVHATPYLL